MAYGAEPAGPGALAHTIYVRPSRELIVRSWHWPACWHRAFEHATAELGLAAATCILNRLRPTRRLIAQQLSIEGVKFHLRRRGTGVYIAVLEFTGPETGPDAPGPNGGCQQPRAADGLGLGLRGSGKSFHLVVFHGYMPAIPAQNVLQLNLFEEIMPSENDKVHSVNSNDQLQVSTGYFVKADYESVQTNPDWRVILMSDDRAARHRPAIHCPVNPRPSPCMSTPGVNARQGSDYCGRMSWRCWPANASIPPAWRQCILTHLEPADAIPFGYLTSGTAEDMSFLEKTALCDWRLRMQKPPSNHLPDRCLN